MDTDHAASAINTDEIASATYRWPLYPYPGIRPFRISRTHNESLIFFGRNAQKDEIIERLNSSQTVFIIGPSGSGKSSLIEVGVIPALQAGFLSSAGHHWRVAKMRPGQTPIDNLVECLAPLAPKRCRTQLALYLHNEPSGLAMISGMLLEAAAPEAKVLIFIDQFEELFGPQIINQPEVDNFVRLITRYYSGSPTQIYLIIAMRADFMGACTSFYGLPHIINNTQYLVPPLGPSELAEAIRRPAEDYKGEVAPELLDRLLNEMRLGSAYDPDSLALLQHSLQWIWQEKWPRYYETPPQPGLAGKAKVSLDLQTYSDAGGMWGILNKCADEIYDTFSEQDQRSIEVIFRRLAERDSEGRYRRCPTSIDTLQRVTGLNESEVRRLLSPFARTPQQLIEIRTGAESGQDGVDLCHESLIRKWAKYKNWSDIEAEKVRMLRRLASRTNDWLQKNELEEFLASEGELASVEQRWKSDAPTPEWAERYSLFPGNSQRLSTLVPEIKRFVETSELQSQQKKREAEIAKIKKATDQYRRYLERIVIVSVLAIVGLIGLSKFQQYKAGTDAALAAAKSDAQTQAEMVRLRREREFWSLTITGLANATRSRRIVYGAADALAIALAKPGDLPRTPEYITTIYQGLAELREKRRISNLPSQIWGVAFSPRNDLLVSVMQGSQAQLQFWSSSTGELLGSVLAPYGGFVMSLRWSPDGERIFVGTSPESAIITPCSNEKLVRYFNSCVGTITDIVVTVGSEEKPAGAGVWSSPRGDLLLTTSFQGAARLWSTKDGVESLPPLEGAKSSTSVAYSPDGKRIAVGVSSGEIEIYDSTSRKLEKRLKPKEAGVNAPFSIAFDPVDSNLLAAGYQNPVARLWDIRSGGETLLKADGGNAFQVAFDPKGKFVVTASNDGAVRIWRIEGNSASEFARLDGHLGPVFSVDVSKEGLIASGSADRSIRLWTDRAPFTPERVFEPVPFKQTAFSIEEGILVVKGEGSDEFRVRVPRGIENNLKDVVLSEGRTGLLVMQHNGTPMLFWRGVGAVAQVAFPLPEADWASFAFSDHDHKIVGKTTSEQVYAWRFFPDIDSLEREAADNLPYAGPDKIVVPDIIRCRLLAGRSDCGVR
jgi:WD40 repeat protein